MPEHLLDTCTDKSVMYQLWCWDGWETEALSMIDHDKDQALSKLASHNVVRRVAHARNSARWTCVSRNC